MSLQSRIRHFLSTDTNKNLYIAEHVVGRRDGNHMDTHIHKEQKQNKKQTSDHFFPCDED